MKEKQETKESRLAAILQQEHMPTKREQLAIVLQMSMPAILAQLTYILMQYIDTAMVGNLGAYASASIGVVATTTYLMNGLCSAISTGFSVQVAEQIGAGKAKEARMILRHALMTALGFSVVLLGIGVAISRPLPLWLGAEQEIATHASAYFFVYALSLPILQMNNLAGMMLQCSGDMKTPSILNATMCVLDVVFNLIFIRKYGVLGAAIGTALAAVVIATAMLFAVCIRSKSLHLNGRDEPFVYQGSILKKMLRIGVPMGFEHIAICGAMIATTAIITPLGTIPLAANSVAVTAESICYMPGYGIASAATALIGQSLGAGKKKVATRFANLTILLGCFVMTAAGVLMYLIAPLVFQMLTPDVQVQELAVRVLRIELLAEPLYAISIVASGALRGAGDSFIPSILNLISIWGVRLTLALFLVREWGLTGVWIAMCVELCVRGILMLLRKIQKLG